MDDYSSHYERSAFSEGWDANEKEHVPLDSNPYECISSRHDDWASGWRAFAKAKLKNPAKYPIVKPSGH